MNLRLWQQAPPPVSHVVFPRGNYPTLKLMLPVIVTITYVQYGSFCVKNSFPSEYLLLFMCMTRDLLVTAKFCVHVLCSTICTTHNILFLVSRSCEDF